MAVRLEPHWTPERGWSAKPWPYFLYGLIFVSAARADLVLSNPGQFVGILLSVWLLACLPFWGVVRLGQKLADAKRRRAAQQMPEQDREPLPPHG